MYYRGAPHKFKTIEWRRRRCIYHLPYIIPLFQNFKTSPKIKKRSQKSASQAGDITLDASIKLKNYPIKNCRRRCILQLLVLYYYFKINKISQKFKNNPIVERSTNQVSDIIIDTCMKFEYYLIKTFGEDAFYSYYILYHYFKISKNRQKFKNNLIVQKRTNQINNIILNACIKFESFPIKTVGDRFWKIV